ncbi:MAG: RDD family protein [Acidobacteria bacterium]|jgi:uncharacterized RDD family membrane protein YckC|nr:RDD family protein [Acidobacteriota bacterium]
MKTMKNISVARVVGRVFIGGLLSTGVVMAQTSGRGPESTFPTDAMSPTRVNPSVPTVDQLTADQLTDRWEEEFRRRRDSRPVVRIGQDYWLREGETVRDVTVIFGSARIDGRVNGTLVVLFGPATLSPTAVVDGALVVLGGTATAAAGAIVRDDVIMVGSTLDLPENFIFGGQHFVFGSRALGARMEAFLPWVTGGLLLGRPIAHSVGWVWSVVGIFFILYLMLNLIAHEPVRTSAEVLSTRPFGSFMVGLLVLVLAGSVSALMLVSVIGIAVIPFAMAALVVAGFLGRVTVMRWLGTTVVASDDPDSRVQALRSLVTGFALLTLVYMVPFLGLLTWALLGVIGLGAVVLAFLAAWRRERPRPEPTRQPATVVAAAAAAAPTPTPTPAATLAYDPPPPTPGADAWTAEPASAAAAGGGGGAPDLTRFPRAQFLDRAGALAIDVLLVAIAYQVLSGPFRWRGDDVMLPLLLIYFIGFWAWKGTTMGGIVTNLRVVKTTGAPVEFVDALIRGLMGVLSFAAAGVGVLWILRDPEGQAWHDKAAGTFVVKVPKSMPIP